MSLASAKPTTPETADPPDADSPGIAGETLRDGGQSEIAETATVTGDFEAEREELPAAEVGETERRGDARRRLAGILVQVVLPAAALLIAAAAGYLKWVDGSAVLAQEARTQSVKAAIDSTVAMLSYRPDTVESSLDAARDRLTGAFRDSYSSLTRDVVIPGAKQKQISATATVPAAASVSATPTHAVVLVFVNQTAVVGNDPPTDTTSSVTVTLEKVANRWLISRFDPV
jgi:Mce-associated membrane protein